MVGIPQILSPGAEGPARTDRPWTLRWTPRTAWTTSDGAPTPTDQRPPAEAYRGELPRAAARHRTAGSHRRTPRHPACEADRPSSSRRAFFHSASDHSQAVCYRRATAPAKVPGTRTREDSLDSDHARSNTGAYQKEDAADCGTHTSKPPHRPRQADLPLQSLMATHGSQSPMPLITHQNGDSVVIRQVRQDLIDRPAAHRYQSNNISTYISTSLIY